MDQLPVETSGSSALLAFDRVPEEELSRPDPAVPLPLSLVVLWCDGKCLLVFNRYQQAWELPGGMLEPDESPRDAAFRELEEESGQRPATPDFVGLARFRVAPDQRIEFGAIYQGQIAQPLPFTENDEITRIAWWKPGEKLPDLEAVDAALVNLCSMP